jgi:hypothetical protein
MSGKRQRRQERAQRDRAALFFTSGRNSQFFVDREQIVISVATPHGRRNLYTFSNKEDLQVGWRVATPPAKIPASSEPFDARFGTAFKQRNASLGVDVNSPLLDTGTVHLEDGFDPPASTLSFILDALHSDKRHEVDLDDIKSVVSQLGSRIAQLNKLSVEQRRHAEPALYALILRCCPTL